MANTSVVEDSARHRLIDVLLGAAQLQVGTDPILAELTETWLRDVIAQADENARTAEDLKAEGRRLFGNSGASDALIDRIGGLGRASNAFLLVTPRPGTILVRTRWGAGGDGAVIATLSLHRGFAATVEDTAFAVLATEIALAQPSGAAPETADLPTPALDGLIATQRRDSPPTGAPPAAGQVAAELTALATASGLSEFVDRLMPVGDEVAGLLRDTAGVAEVAGMLALPPAGTVPGRREAVASADGRQRRRLAAAALRLGVRSAETALGLA